ncbi:MAG: Ig-like domain-containing protein, partial [bacterium]|nr:Ig-like domain-containing protein [bacterium]
AADDTYRVRSRATDSAGNIEATDMVTFTLDTTPPSATITSPGPDDVLRDITHITGSAIDNLSGIERVEVSIKQALSQTYWSGAAWVTTPTWFMALGTTDWTFSWPAAIWDGAYTVQARATDKVNNVEAPEEGNTFTLDKTYPASYISTPARGAVLGSLPQVKGTATDGLSSIAKVEISIWKNGLYWKNTTWVTPPTWLPVNGTTSWSYIWPAGLMSGSYTLTSRATDAAGNEEIPVLSTTFILDTEGPVSRITSPQSGAILQSLAQIAGTAGDEESGIKKVEVSIRNETDQTYWNGSHWVTQEYWLPAMGTANWSFPWPALGGGCYLVTVKSRATNGADIQETPGPGVSFTVDDAPPSTVINAPREGDVLTYLGQITGTIQDGCTPIDRVEVAIKQKTTGSYWNGAKWLPAQSWLRANGTSSWALTWPGLIGNGEYTILGRTVDQAGNVETSLAPGRNWVNFMLDSTPPGSTIVSPRSGAMLNILTQISGTANDDFSGVKKVEIAIRRADDQNYWNGITWQGSRILLQTFGTNSWNYPWPQQAGDGTYTVTAQATDQAGNLGPLLGGITFTLDAAPPESRITYPANNQIITTSFQISGTANDNRSGVAGVALAIRNKDGNYYNGSTWVAQEFWISVQGLNSWIYTWPKLDDAVYDLYSRATDLAGNVEMPSSPVHFTFVSKGPASSITLPLDGKGLTALTEITGTAKDNLLRITQVEVSIRREDIGTYWNGYGWVMISGWVTVSGTEVWAYSWPQGSGDGRFTVWSRATNEAGMVETPGRGNTFSLDNTAPASWITSPIENATLTALTKIEGKSSDNLSGVSKVDLSIKRNRDGNYWNGTNWAQGQSWVVASGTTTWELAWPKTTDGSYTLQSRATDVSGNPENPQTSRNFTLVDKTAPSSQVTSPANGAVINKGLAMIQGTAEDDMSGVALVEVAVKRKSDGAYWNGSAWELSAAKLWLGAGGTDSWSSPWPPGVSDGDYLIYSRAQDLAGNIEIKEAGAQVTIDSILPASKVTSSYDGAVLGNLSQISGTASDNLGVSKVEVSIQRSGTGRYFTGTGWSPTQTWLQAAGTNSWIYDLSVKIVEDDHYLITSRATDIAGNVESPTVTITVIIDTISSVSTITSPTDGQEINYLGQISGIAADDGGVAQVGVSIRRISNGTYWNGSNWQINQFWLSATGTTSWTYAWPSGIPENVSYLIQSRATDIAGHVEIPKKGNTVTIDTTAPVNPTLSLSDQTSGSQNYTDDRMVNVSIGNDPGVAEYLLSETLSSAPGSSDWQTLGTKTKPAIYTLRSGDGPKTVFIWVRDKATNVNPGQVSAQITLDMSGPVITGIPTENSPDNDYDEDGRYTVYWTAASDPQSGVAGYEIQEKVGENGQWTTLSNAIASGVTNYSITGRSKGKTYSYRVRAKNGVGNWGDYSSSSDGIEVADRIGSSGGTATDAQGEAKVEVPPRSFKDDLNVVIETDPINNPNEVDPDDIEKADAKKDINLGSGGLMEINLYDAWDQPVDNLSSAITIILSYPDGDQDGYVDGTQPPLNELTLKIYRLDETAQEWTPVPGSVVDPVKNTVSVDITHTSVYRWWGTATPVNLSNPIVYPNPFKASKHNEINFGSKAEPAKMLSVNTTIEIYTLSGELVQTIKEGEDADPNNGQAIWKVSDDISAGLYFYIITNPSGDKVTGKLAIIR